MKITNEEELDLVLSEPSPSTVELMTHLKGDIAILGIGGKIGPTLGRMATRSVSKSGKKKTVFGISRFSETGLREKLEAWGLHTIPCDLLDRDAVAKLPKVDNVIFMAGRKFGTSDGGEALTWAMNTTVPSIIADHFKDSKIVVFSTGCVYPLVQRNGGGCNEDAKPEPSGEYAQSCLGRERVFEYYSNRFGTRILLFRLNYAIDLRYGVLFDIATNIWKNQPVTNSVGNFNAIWQGDVNDWALRSLEWCGSPARILNVTGPDVVAVAYVAEKMGKIMGKKVTYSQDIPGNACYLSDATKAISRFGNPRLKMDEMIQLQAEWIMAGGRSLNKPTHFEINNGKF